MIPIHPIAMRIHASRVNPCGDYINPWDPQMIDADDRIIALPESP